MPDTETEASSFLDQVSHLFRTLPHGGTSTGQPSRKNFSHSSNDSSRLNDTDLAKKILLSFSDLMSIKYAGAAKYISPTRALPAQCLCCGVRDQCMEPDPISNEWLHECLSVRHV